MDKIFSPKYTSFHYPIVLSSNADQAVMDRINFQRMADSWRPISFEMLRKNKQELPPEISVIQCIIAFNKKHLEQLSRIFNDCVEYLPKTVDGEPWIMLNTLGSYRGIDLERSVYYKNEDGQIFYIPKLVMHSLTDRTCGIFTVEGSNRSRCLVSGEVVSQITQLNLDGMAFAEIGEFIE